MSKKLNKIYRDILKKVNYSGIIELNKRTNTLISISKEPLFFTLDLSDNILPIVGNRTIWPHIAAAEFAWQTQGTKDPSFILKYAPKLWSKFIEDGELKTAYGYRWHKHFDRDQLKLGCKALVADKTNRQIYISNWDPKTDGLGEPKNIPCPLGFTLNVIDDKLNMSVFIRSSDIFIGLPYDILSYSLTLDVLSNTLKIPKRNISFTLAHAHCYQPHFKHIIENLTGEQKQWRNIDLEFLNFDYSTVKSRPENFVKAYKKYKINNYWNPKPEVIV